MLRVNTLMFGLSLCVLPGFVAAIPVFAKDRVIQEIIIESKISRPVAVRRLMEVHTIYAMGKPDFEKRIADLNSWIELGVSKGWLDRVRAGAFKSETARLTDFLSTHTLPDGYFTRSVNDTMEKQLNILSADIATTMSGTAQVAGLEQFH